MGVKMPDAKTISQQYKFAASNTFNLHGELGYSKSIDSKSAGSVKGGVSAGGGGFIEATENGVSDWGVIVRSEVKVGAGGDIKWVQEAVARKILSL